jgi:hypothetical protein
MVGPVLLGERVGDVDDVIVRTLSLAACLARRRTNELSSSCRMAFVDWQGGVVFIPPI